MVAVLLLCCLADSLPAPDVAVIPHPAHIERDTGWVSVLARTPVVTDREELHDLAARARDLLADQAPPDGAETGVLRLTLAPEGDLPREGYQLTVSAAGIEIRGADAAGAFYGLETFRQLLPRDGSGRVPVVTIRDAPRLSYRGLHLDVGRHLFPVAFIKRYIDLLAHYKLNVFHWHLTDDQGWRLEIREYPRLTSVGAWRRETIVGKQFDPYVGDGQPYGGFYTQEQVREIVAYAAARHVTVIPEIEMPGHSLAALAAYPDLACTAGPFEVGTRWGVYDDVYCPSERTFRFLEDVLSEVLELFPSPFIHIGGDEVSKRRWQQSALAQEVIRREGLRDERELQSWFVRRIETFLRSRGRRLIGWDEILEGGLAPGATVMSWRGMAGGIAAARQGHDVIMTPGSHLYFDHYQGSRDTEPLAIGGYTPIERVYAFDPVPPELTPEEARHVLGAQANVWTEYLPTAAHVEYMAYPRVLALAEVVWSPRASRSWESFQARLPEHLARLDDRDVNYRIPAPGGLTGHGLVLGDSVTLTLTSPLPHARIWWTAGTPTTSEARLVQGPVRLPVTAGGVEVSAWIELPNGRRGAAARARIRRATLRPAERTDTAGLAPGLDYAYHERPVRRAQDLRRSVPTHRGTVTTAGLRGTERAEHFGVRLTGLLRVPADDVYEFELISDDGSMLGIAGATVVDHDGAHSARPAYGAVALAAGLHPFELAYFQGEGDRTLALRVRAGAGDWRDVPAEWLYRRP